MVNVQYGQQEVKRLPLIVVKGDGPPLLGRNWLQHVHLDWKTIKKVAQHPDPKRSLELLQEKYKDVFQDKLGHVQDFKAKVLALYGKRPGQSFSCLDRFLLQ